MIELDLNNHWDELLKVEINKPYFKDLLQFLEKEYQEKTIYPEKEEIFSALRYTDYNHVKVVLLGQDPYHGPGQAHGLSFSVKPGVKLPPSLKNIFKELQNDLGYDIPDHGYLKKWAEQGVLLLNTVLTVRSGEAYSHKGKGWETFTDEVISLINQREKPVIFLLWGRQAQSKLKWIDREKHFVLMSAHPSPLSANRGFFGSKPFSQINKFLVEIGENPIHWQI